MSEQQPSYPQPPMGEAPPSMPPRLDQQMPYPPPPPPATGSQPNMPTGPEQQYYPPPPNPATGTEQQYYAPAPNPATGTEQQHHPPPPPRPQDQQYTHPPPQDQGDFPPYNPQDYADEKLDKQHLYPPPPPKRQSNRYSGEQDIASPIHYTRDPKKLVAYLIPFPKPNIPDVPPESIPPRFMIYTPPPPPFIDKPAEGEKEGRVHKVQRKWADEVREAKTGNTKTMSWKGVKGKAIKGIDWAAGQTKSSNLEFLNRIGGSESPQQDTHANDGVQEGDSTKATVKLEEMLLVYPSSMSGSPEEIREEFINTMLRGKSKAQRDAVLATGLLPVSLAIDILITFIWPFGGLLEIDAVWAAASIRGAKNSRSVTKRLTSGGKTGSPDEDKLHLNFTPSPRLAVLDKYLATRCHDRAADLFPMAGISPSETEVLESIGWFPSSKGGVERNWEDEQWEISEVKEDLKSVMGKAAREWDKWCRAFQKQPEKAIKK